MSAAAVKPTTAAAPPASRLSGDWPAGRPIGLTLVSAKMVMAITGTGLLIFVAVHMLGNLQIYRGQEQLNAYAKFLKSMPLLLWSARARTLGHFWPASGSGCLFEKAKQAARPQHYVVNDPIETTLASRTMLSSGLVILAFVIYHLLHFTLGVTDPEQPPPGRFGRAARCLLDGRAWFQQYLRLWSLCRCDVVSRPASQSRVVEYPANIWRDGQSL